VVIDHLFIIKTSPSMIGVHKSVASVKATIIHFFLHYDYRYTVFVLFTYLSLVE
jgi:hypothetical protein